MQEHRLPIRHYEDVRRYTSDDLQWTESYQDAIRNLTNYVIDTQKPQTEEGGLLETGIFLALQMGCEMATTRIRQLVEYSDPIQRHIMVQELSMNPEQSEWLARLNTWRQKEDPYGLLILEELKKQDVEEILNQSGSTKDELEEIKRYRVQAEAVKKGQELVIDYYKNLVSPSEE